MSKYDNFINKLIPYLIIIFVFSDVLTSIFNLKAVGISTILRGIFLLLIIIYLYKKKFNRKLLITILIYFILEFGYLFLFTKSNLFKELIYVSKIFYLPILLLFFSKYENKKIDDRFIYMLYLILLNITLLLGLFNINIDNYEIYAILIGLSPVVINYVINIKSHIIKILFYLELLAVILLSSNFYLLIILSLIFIYYYIRYIRNNFKKKKIFILLLPIIAIVLVTIYYINGNIKMISFEFSNIININSIYKSFNKYSIMYGLSSEKVLSLGSIKNDIINIFYSIGIFGIAIYILLIITIFRKIKIRKQYKFSLLLFIIMSLIFGRVLTNASVSTFIAILLLLNKNEVKIMKKRILLVSNMYPSNKYKHYGSFVKNAKEVLEENGYIVDKSVMYKQDSKIIKLFSYIFFYIKTILKGMFNNYDYIYVHFISHSALPAVFLKKTCKDVCLVLNAHGNDVVKDLPSEEKNIKRSKKYLKYADKVVVPSNYYKTVIMNNYNIEENKIYVYPSGGVDTDKYINKDMRIAKKECNLKEQYDYIGYVSRIEKNKGWDTFLKMIKLLKDENKIEGKRFLIVGSGSEETKMNELMKKLDIVDYVETRGLVSPDELINIYNSLKIFVFPTYRESESLGLVGLEAMSCETFVIASENYGPTDYVKNMKNGLFFKPQDYVDLKNKILEYDKLNNEQKKKIIKKARETALNYDVRNTKNEILKVFK